MKADKILAITGFFCIIAALCLVVGTPLAAHYETSIYGAYQWYFWIAICAGLLCGILVILRQALSRGPSSWWLVGLLIVLMANSIILLLPFFRGYLVLGRDDPLGHLLLVKDVISTGKAAGNYYPASHVLAASLSMVCGVDPAIIVNCLPAVFSVVYILGMCSLAAVVGRSHGQVLLICGLGTVLLFSNYGSMFLPTHFAFAFTPLILFLFLNVRSVSGNVVLAVLLLVMPIFHIFACVMLAAFFLLYELCLALWRRLSRQGSVRDGFRSAQPVLREPSAVTPALIVLVGGSAWYSSFAAFAADARDLRAFLLYGIGERPAYTIASGTNQASLRVFDLLYMFVRGYGHELMYAMMAVIAILIVIRRVRWTRNLVAVHEIFFGSVFVVFSLAFFPFLLGSFLFLNPLREFEWALMAATVVSGMVFYEAIFPGGTTESKWRPWRKVAMVILALVLVVSSIVGVFGAYYSPLYGLTNPQVTRAEMSGMQWFLTHSIYEMPTINIRYIGEFAWRSLGAGVLPGYEFVVDGRHLLCTQAPPHFGYQEENSLAPELSSAGYLVITRCDKLTASEVWHERGDYTTQDFDRLYNERALGEVYCNGELEVWLALSSQGTA